MENSEEECHRAGCGGGGGAGGRQLQQQRRYCHQGNQLKKLENRPPGMDRAETSKNHSIGFSSFQKIIYKVSVRSFHIWRSTVECILACILPNNTDSGFGI